MKQRKNHKIKRPFATLYYKDAHGALSLPEPHGGAAATEQGAIRAALVRVFLGQYAKALIMDRRSNVALYHIVPTAAGYQLRFGSGVEPKKWVQPKKG